MLRDLIFFIEKLLSIDAVRNIIKPVIVKKALVVALLVIGPASWSCADENQQKAKGLDMVSDTVATTFKKATALLEGKLEVTMSLDKTNTTTQFSTNAIGQKVPKATAIKSAGSLHNDEPL